MISPQHLRRTILMAIINMQGRHGLHQFLWYSWKADRECLHTAFHSSCRCKALGRLLWSTVLYSATSTIMTVSVLQVWAWCVALTMTFLIWLFKKQLGKNQYISFVSIHLVNTNCNQRACTLTYDFSLSAMFTCSSTVIF